MGVMVAAALYAGCSATTAGDDEGEGGAAGSGAGGGAGTSGGGGMGGGTGGTGGTGGGLVIDGGGGTGGGISRDPETCAEAAEHRTYLGCDFYPTVTANAVWNVFDFAVVVANAGATDTEAVVTLGGAEVARQPVPANGLAKIYLPWVPELKGEPSNECGSVTQITTSVLARNKAFRLQTTTPVTVYQFNALEYKPAGGPPGKDWSTCSGNRVCADQGSPIGCFSYSNDASLLLPATAMTGNYRIGAMGGGTAPFVTITAVEDNTSLTFTGRGNARWVAGGGISAASSGTFSLNRGDVLQLVGPKETQGGPAIDFSGSLVKAERPVQVIVGNGCTIINNKPACDHIEESVLPAETLGRRYFVASPTGPSGGVPGHVVRLIGNADGTQLTYRGAPPAGAPSVINAGQMVSLGKVTGSFEVEGTQEFMVTSFMLGGGEINPMAGANSKGDPSQTFHVAVEQYRKKYVFLAPTDYDVSYADIIAPVGTTLTLDGQPVTAPRQPIATGYEIVRAKLSPNQEAHLLVASEPVGLHVAGYGNYTSYYYPAGLNLAIIAPPPIQ